MLIILLLLDNNFQRFFFFLLFPHIHGFLPSAFSRGGYVVYEGIWLSWFARMVRPSNSIRQRNALQVQLLHLICLVDT